MSIEAKIELTDGRVMSLRLYPEHAPKSVENFVKLCKENFYCGLCFHRVIPSFMIQGGGFAIEGGALKQKTAAAIEGEFAANHIKNDLKHVKGVISMARTSDKNSASCQFFICVADCDYLDGNYAAFGELIDEQSVQVAMEISGVKTGKWMMYDDVPVQPVIIKAITVE